MSVLLQTLSIANGNHSRLKEFMKKLEEKRVGLNKATSMGEAILTICHPDSITTIKHWNTIIKARFEEVSSQLHACLLCSIAKSLEPISWQSHVSPEI